jgi:methionine aminotransferase
MSALAEQHGAVNLSQGFPDFDPPARLLELVSAALAGGRNQYAPMAGVPALREAVAAKLAACYAVDADPDSEITIAAGATEALFAAIHALVRSGDEVIVFDPAYDSYEPAVTLAGGITRRLPLTLPDFRLDWELLASSLGPRTRLVIINTPHNPTGTSLSKDDLQRLAELLRPYDCYVLSDEVYEHIVFDGRAHTCILSLPELAERAICVSSFGKTYHATGWKLGYAVAPAALTAEFRRVHQFLMFAAVTPMQHALAQYAAEHPEHYAELAVFYQSKREYFLSALADSRFRFTPAQGTYFQLGDYAEIADIDDVDFVRRLTIEHGVAAIPISVFYREPPRTRLVRFCFAKRNATLDAAAAKLRGLSTL